MRLKDYQVAAITESARRRFGPDARVYLFGSRTDDTRRGGDIDLYVESDTPIPDRSKAERGFEVDLLKALGDRKIDIVVWDPEVTTASIHRRAKETGVELR
jgi:predicted nucleotidyltransferase